MIGIIKPGKVDLYVRSMGKVLKVTAIALNTEIANAYMEKHQEAAMVAEVGDLILLADQYDPGITIPKEQR